MYITAQRYMPVLHVWIMYSKYMFVYMYSMYTHMYRFSSNRHLVLRDCVDPSLIPTYLRITAPEKHFISALRYEILSFPCGAVFWNESVCTTLNWLGLGCLTRSGNFPLMGRLVTQRELLKAIRIPTMGCRLSQKSKLLLS